MNNPAAPGTSTRGRGRHACSHSARPSCARMGARCSLAGDTGRPAGPPCACAGSSRPRHTAPAAARVSCHAHGPAPRLDGQFRPLWPARPARAACPPRWEKTITGTRSVIHGDLNLENVLVGPGSLVWLIDFAQTREGHPLFDFAHLESELIAHVLAVRAGSPRAYLDLWQRGSDPLLNCAARDRRALPVRPGPPARVSPGAVPGLPGRAEIPESRRGLARHCLLSDRGGLGEEKFP